MRNECRNRVLKGVSRSFYLTLRLLPGPMREAAGVGYLLARTSDTIADCAGMPREERAALLERFEEAVADGRPLPAWPEEWLETVPAGERVLLENGEGVFEWFGELLPEEAALVREVVAIIIGGQKFDLEFFSAAEQGAVVSLPDGAALEDYAWRVAGCVGAFWTKLGFATLGRGFSASSEATLLEKGVAYGKGLQLVNILRDLPEDLAGGRCYLPVDLRNREALMTAYAGWVERAAGWVAEGLEYADSLKSRRLRVASALPALIAEKTLEQLRGASWEALERRIKISRRSVYGSLADSFFRAL